MVNYILKELHVLLRQAVASVITGVDKSKNRILKLESICY